ncbi:MULTISPECIES: ATP-dependent helicase [unclassified Bradyrhizobium]|uniref:ATP-dependent helicase n=1 Tax=unclassified Bradyrhizobium TaxID=2631580 RepID=UPI0029163604|nr:MULTISPECIES: ATP-dependent helicase [unclassified Bradyrhizobium]
MSRLIRPEAWQPSDGIRLEDAARRVVMSTQNRSVIAGPGAGKTELLAQRALYLLQTGLCKPPQRILAISFKRDAAKTLKDRVSRRCSPEQAQRFDSYTFDAFAKSLVDRFIAVTPEWCRPPRDYRIVFPRRNDWLDFIRGLEPPRRLGGMAAAQALQSEAIERWGPLPLILEEPTEILPWVAVEWWRTSLGDRHPGLTFAMISRLAEAILSHNPQILKALQLTYSHVFLDEFQDTTRAQFRFITTGFARSRAVLTAVGDTKQRIMTWAGAESEVFTWFEEQFRARRERLQLNYRSNRRIVQIINDLVREIEPDAVNTLCARPDEEVPADAAAFWIFDTDEDECNYLADVIANDIDRGLKPDDFVLLVRVRADQAEARLRDAFAAHNLRLRNEARLIRGIAIQELVTDDLVGLLLGLIRLALGVRGHDIYTAVQQSLEAILGTDFENPSDIKHLDSTLRRIIGGIRNLTHAPPAQADFSALIRYIVGELGLAPIRRVFRQYENDTYFNDVQEALADLFSEFGSEADSWPALVDAAEGRGQVRLMTVHKSKGLEYHTVIFVGLHQNAFFGYRNNREEETNAFFVALSRARERVYFTRSKQGGGVREIQGLVDLLTNAAVPIVEF